MGPICRQPPPRIPQLGSHHHPRRGVCHCTRRVRYHRDGGRQATRKLRTGLVRIRICSPGHSYHAVLEGDLDHYRHKRPRSQREATLGLPDDEDALLGGDYCMESCEGEQLRFAER